MHALTESNSVGPNICSHSDAETVLFLKFVDLINC